MNNDKSKPSGAAKGQPAAPAPASKAPAPVKGAAPGKPAPPEAAPAAASAPLFRRTDWLTFLITFGIVWLGYFLTLAPEHTLEDSGELATGSFYAGIPH